MVKLNEEQLRPLVVKQVKKAFKEGEEMWDMHKAIMMVRVMNTLLDGLKEYFVPLIGLYIDKIIDILKFMGEQSSNQEKKRKRN